MTTTRVRALLGLLLTVGAAACSGSGDDDAAQGPAAEVNAAQRGKHCTLARLHDDGIFEESLSTDEYPDVGFELSEGKWDLSIGSSSITDGDDGYRVTVVDAVGATTATATSAETKYRVVVRRTEGQVFAKSGAEEEVLVADLKNCETR